MQLPFELETELERRISSDPEWRRGAAWGKPRPGHPEGAVAAHIADVLRNVEREARSPEERGRLRLAALIRDTFEYAVDASRPRMGENHHGGGRAASPSSTSTTWGCSSCSSCTTRHTQAGSRDGVTRSAVSGEPCV